MTMNVHICWYKLKSMEMCRTIFGDQKYDQNTKYELICHRINNQVKYFVIPN